MKKRLFLFLTLSTSLWADIDFEQMVSDLELVYWIDKSLEKRVPIHYNYMLSTGYFVTPSARMSEAGVIGLGVGSLPPSLYYNGLIQPFSHLELTLHSHASENFTNKGANLKVSLITPEDSSYVFPGIALGIENFIGPKEYASYFIVGTQVWKPLGLELSLGWGAGRYQEGPSEGFFGALSWHPFARKNSTFLEGLALSGEYDPIDYRKEREGIDTSFPINFGLQYNYNNLLQTSISCWRGEEIAATAAITYNWGATRGFFPRIDDPPPFFRSYSREFTHYEICDSFKKQGFILRNSYLCGDLIILTVTNCMWIRERDMRHRLVHLLAHFPYTDVKRFIILLKSHNLACQSYSFDKSWIDTYCKGEMGEFEFDLLTHRKEPFPIDPSSATLLYNSIAYKPLWWLEPRFESFFQGGKNKYDIGLQGNLEGSLPFHLFYEIKGSITLLSSLNNSPLCDSSAAPSLPIVATDYINYRNQGGFSTDRLYLQALQNFPSAFFGKIAAGYFQVNYGGIGGEFLWYPAHSSLAIGIEAALLKKRSYNGLGFQSSLAFLEQGTLTYDPYTILEQYFLDIYYDIPECSLFTKLSLGGFLAKDRGGRLEMTRYFQSGLRLTGWITMTNAKDSMESIHYFDRGISIEMPLELFYKKSGRRIFTYGLAAWLRNAGYRSAVGRSLFEIINRERRF